MNKIEQIPLGGDNYFNVPNIVYDASNLSPAAHVLYVYLCNLANKRKTRALTGNILEEYINHFSEDVKQHYSIDLCFDGLYELTFPRIELGGKSYISIERPAYLTEAEELEDERNPRHTRRIIHLNDISEANYRQQQWQARLGQHKEE